MIAVAMSGTIDPFHDQHRHTAVPRHRTLNAVARGPTPSRRPTSRSEMPFARSKATSAWTNSKTPSPHHHTAHAKPPTTPPRPYQTTPPTPTTPNYPPPPRPPPP